MECFGLMIGRDRLRRMKKYCLAAWIFLIVCVCLPAFAQISIKEVVSQNLSLHLGESGKAYDYVILTNTGAEALDLTGYVLSKEGGKDTYTLAGEVLEPGEDLLIYCTGEKEGAPFKLSAEGVTVYLHDAKGTLVEKVAVPPMSYNQRYLGGKVLEGNDCPKGDLYISEILADNTLLLENGGTPDFVELHNAGASDIHLKDYGLSDNPNKPDKWHFKDVILPAGGYLTVYLTEEEMGFGLSNDGECVLVTDPDNKTVDFVTFGEQENDVALAYFDGAYHKTWTPTPNEANKITGKEAYEQSVYELNPAGLYINEVVASNGTFDDNGNAYDYVELYNGTKKKIALTDFFLSSDAAHTESWAFPKGAALSPGTYAVVFMAAREIQSSRPNTYYASFKLEKTNGAVLLYNSQGMADHISLGRQYGNISYGRAPFQGAFSFFAEQTPRAQNPAEGFATRAGDVTIEPAGGLYDKPVTVTLTAQGNAVIRCTLDGSTPTEDSPAYTAPIAVSGNTVVRARAFSDGVLPSSVSSAGYLYGVSVNVPVVSLITDEKYLTDYGMGLLVKGSGEPANYYQEWEYPMHVQYFDQGHMLINQLASFRTSGAVGLTRPQKSMSLFARGALGEDKFYFNPFPHRTYDSYNALTLRSGGTESRGTRFKDELLTSLAEGLNVLYQDAVPVVVYLNGQYYGHYNLREKINQDSIAQWEGVTDEKTIGNITILRSRGSIVHGSRDEIGPLIQFCKNKNLNDPDNLKYVTDRLDVMSWFDHAILEIIAGNTDMHNVRYYKVPGGKWKVALFDLDGSMDGLFRTPLTLYLTKPSAKMDKFYHEPIAALLQVPQMRDLFLTRFGEILHDKCIAAEMEKKVDDWAGIIGPLMQDHVKRWPDTSLSKWQSCVDLLRKNVRERPAKVVTYLADAFDLTQEQIQQYFGAFLNANQ